ncbi:MAG: eukaryotic-like serine/threonine-protein kinase [Acidobacteriota bacterium]|nr:eukaryotic-like serine/threonine-protein kinase [Acidobacteriota bacterium]
MVSAFLLPFTFYLFPFVKALATETIIGNYRIEERIGRGGMGIVYRGHHLKLPREVAIKSISASSHRDLRRLRPRFEKEAFIQSQLDHPGIVKIYDYIVAEQTYYIVMEFVEGRSLAQLIEHERGALPVERALDLFEQMLAAIAYAQDFVYQDQDGSSHKGLIHRDLKPANLLITPDDRVKITDFGIVKLVGSEKTNTGGNYGSPEYVSPEQAEGTPVDPRSDIYSLGIILYEMLTGEPPFHDHGGKLSQLEIVRAHIQQSPPLPSRLNAQVTPQLEAVILRAVEKKPENRFASCLEFLRAVRHVRGRETDEIVQGARIAQPTRIKVGTQEIVSPTISDSERESQLTQPIKAQACPSCGAGTGESDTHCRQCGHELGGSPATVRLTHYEAEEWQRKRSRGLWVGIIAFMLALAGTIIFFALRRNVTPEDKSAAQSSATPAETFDAALLEIKPARVEVDSSYDGYTATPLTDNEWDVRRIAEMKYNEGNWASAETPAPHWIELNFDKPVRLAAVYLYWGFDRNRFMPSRRVELQMRDERGRWQTVSRMEPDKDFDRMAFEFAPTITTRARILQPAQQGPPNRPFIMWVREVKIFGLKEP